MGKATENKILNIPNTLSVFKIVFIAPLIGYFYTKGNNITATTLCGFFVITDVLDGFLARKLKQVTNFGIYIDAIGDNLFAAIVAFSFLYQGYFTWPLIAFAAAHRFIRLFLVIFVSFYGKGYYFPIYMKLTALIPTIYIFTVPFLANFIGYSTTEKMTTGVLASAVFILTLMTAFAIFRLKKGKLKMTNVEKIEVKKLLKVR